MKIDNVISNNKFSPVNDYEIKKTNTEQITPSKSPDAN